MAWGPDPVAGWSPPPDVGRPPSTGAPIAGVDVQRNRAVRHRPRTHARSPVARTVPLHLQRPAGTSLTAVPSYGPTRPARSYARSRARSLPHDALAHLRRTLPEESLCPRPARPRHRPPDRDHASHWPRAQCFASSRGSTRSPTRTGCTRAPATSSCTGSASSVRPPPGCSAASPTASRCRRTGSTSTWPRRPARLGLGEQMGKNSPFRRALARLSPSSWPAPTARASWPSGPHIPPLPLRHLSRLPEPLQREPPAVDGRTAPARARADAAPGPAVGRRPGRSRARPGLDRAALGAWHFHPAVAFQAAAEALVATGAPRIEWHDGRRAGIRETDRGGSAGLGLVAGRGEAPVGVDRLDLPLHHLVDHAADGQVEPVASRPARGPPWPCSRPSATMCISARMSSSLRPLPSCSPDPPVPAVRAHAGGDEVAHARPGRRTWRAGHPWPPRAGSARPGPGT